MPERGASSPDASSQSHSTAPAPSDSRGIIAYDPSLNDELYGFQRTAYPQRPAEWTMPRWRWMFLDSARRCSTPPMVWLYRGKTGIAGHQGAIAVRLQVNGQRLVTGWFVETMVLESVRGRAAGPMLIQKSLEDMPFNVSLGQTEQMRAIQFALGWKQVAPLPLYAHLINPDRVLADKVRNPLVRRLTTSALWGIQRIRRLVGAFRADKTTAVKEVERFDERHDRLWDRVGSEYRCAVMRDSSYLNWKYVDQPAQEYVRLELSKNGEPAAVVVLMFREADDAYRYRRGFIVDLVAPLAEPGMVRAALLAAVEECRRRGADAVVLAALNRSLERCALQCGFLRRPPTRYLLVATGGLSDALASDLLTAENWFVTLGDSDIDRPW